MANPVEAVLRVLNAMVKGRVLIDYAIGGAVAAIFWGEPIDTADVDVFVVVPGDGVLISLGSAYAWLIDHGYKLDGEHARIAGMPVQFLAAMPGLGDEAIEKASVETIGRVATKVITAEYLVALWLQGSAFSPKRRARIVAMLEADLVDRRVLRSILARHKISDRGLV